MKLIMLSLVYKGLRAPLACWWFQFGHIRLAKLKVFKFSVPNCKSAQFLPNIGILRNFVFFQLEWILASISSFYGTTNQLQSEASNYSKRNKNSNTLLCVPFKLVIRYNRFMITSSLEMTALSLLLGVTGATVE